ncbi:MAG: hypothetical protein HY332_00685 [Chloroflexi bacterium]|nr:hypothetical protein [Chloroflexota bacterium]
MAVQALGLRRSTRRALGIGAAAAACGAALSRISNAAGAAPSASPAAASSPPGVTIGGLRPVPPGEAPFDAAGRHSLAMDLLTFFARQQGIFPGRGVFLLPAAPWFGGHEPAATKRVWDMSIPSGAPIYLLADANPSGTLDASETTITVNGATVPDVDTYVHAGVPALHSGGMREHAVLDLVFAPPPSGHYRIEVRARFEPQSAGDDAAGETAAPGGGAAENETTLIYDFIVKPPDVLGPLALRDPSGTAYATLGGERRRIPDSDTLRLLGYPPDMIVSASHETLAAIPEGPALPFLREGMLVRAGDHPAIFRLQDGKRRWIKNPQSIAASGEEVRTIDAPVLQTIPPLLDDDLLLKGTVSDAFHVERGSLRKVPDWQWVASRGLDPDNLLFVADRVLAGLPQDSPHWMMPGGAWIDRWFDSPALGRSMPYRVYLPPNYDAPERAGRRYPVIYLLHGVSGRYDEWSGYGVDQVANDLLADGKFAHTIIVMPQGGMGYWMNQDGGTFWGDYVARDLVEHVDATFRTIPKREARAIGGLSMGAHGAMQLALNHPDVFGIAGAHSPSIRSQESAPAYFGTNGGFARRDPISLVRDLTLSPPPVIWIDTGDKDAWRWSAEALREALLERGWAHEWHVFPGEHDGWYWGDHIWDYLQFYSSAFAKVGIPLVR